MYFYRLSQYTYEYENEFLLSNEKRYSYDEFLNLCREAKEKGAYDICEYLEQHGFKLTGEDIECEVCLNDL